jgi:hypothetical protein
MGSAGKAAAAEKFTTEAMMQKIAAAYTGLLKPGGSARETG